ncbi:TlyA family RNA methyltransferase [Cohnella thermotolerans]|uniref:TlyA family RNA methyltransferase n=1 Tax=Cohnella thermotolerans TaxID=329858 RepID=UPI00047C9885|nr:TlyA family RNA methyltransferase [Cohnella thermotolerans]
MTAIGKERLDVLLVEQGYFESREKAKAAIMAGLVLVGSERIDKAGTKVPRDAAITVKGAPHPYVSRGGLKLEKAIRHFGIDLEGAVMLDIGASTGGFTDCALQHGASFVYALDVGYNQLDWSLRQDKRVCVMERTNFRHVTAEHLQGPRPGFATIDVSFISLKLILPALKPLLAPGGGTVALIKPQFEAGREQVGKSGVVRDSSVHAAVVKDVLLFANELGFELQGLTYSPITGGEGNIEFLAYWKLGDAAPSEEQVAAGKLAQLADRTVQEAAAAFRGIRD